jgi:outer membrane receptor protein involved in Fe transport
LDWSYHRLLGFLDNGEAWIQYIRFSENDDRARITNQVCVTNRVPLQGCVPGEFGFDGPNLGSTTGTIFASFFGALPTGDGGNNLPGSTITYSYPRPQLGFRSMHTDFEPIYRSEEDVVSLGIDYRFDNYSVSLLGAYQETESDFYQDYNMDVGPDLADIGIGPYVISAPAGGAGGDWGNGPCNYNDGTAGIAGGCIFDMATDRSVSYDYSSSSSEYWTVEARIQSNLDGPFNFLVGASAYDSGNSGDYYVIANTLDLVGTVLGSYPSGYNSSRAGNNEGLETDGHAYFAEVYYDLNDRAKLTAGLRRNKDNKFVRDANAFLDGAYINPADPSLGYSREAGFAQGGAVGDEDLVALYGATQAFADASTTAALSAERLAAVALIPPVPQPGEVRKITGSPQDFTWEETTGRIGIDYKLTDDNLLYAFYSVGYKPGGFNPPVNRIFQGDIKFDFDQEEISSIEIGSKNTLLDGTMKLNGSVFVYDYEGLQITRIANNSSINDNIDAEMWGAEIEFEWYPDMLPGVSIDGAYSFLDTEVANGAESVDPTNRTAGNPAWTAVNDYSTDATAGVNYVVDTQLYTDNLATLLGAGVAIPFPGTVRDNGLPVYLNRAGVQQVPGVGIDFDAGTLSNGIAQDLGGNSLPNSPEHTIKLGVAYAMPSPVFDGDLIVRLDYYWQDDMYAREFNTKGDLIESWDQFNLSLIFESADGKWGARAWARNLADEDNITGHYLTSDTSGFYRNYFLTEPRIVGASIRYNFGY